MQIIDTHCHLNLPAFDPDRQAVLERARAGGVTDLVLPAVSRAGWNSLIEYCNPDPGLHYALGVHPHYADQHCNQDLDHLASIVSGLTPVAIGETGLDFQLGEYDREHQERIFIKHLELAETTGLPLILHVRKAHDRVLELLKDSGATGGIVHAFNGSLQQAERYNALGFKFGFGGMLTYERSSHLRRLARELPLDTLVLETDAPDMTVSQHRGERNKPEYLRHCLQALAAVRDENEAVIAAATTANAFDILNGMRQTSVTL